MKSLRPYKKTRRTMWQNKYMNEKTFLSEYQKLNRAQKQAVDEIEGPVMVIAGPGTGKTQIIAMRIAQILRQTQTNPSNILCLTFTNSGVYAMKQRLLEIIGAPSYQIHIHTFHQFCNEIIAAFPEKFLIANDLNQLLELEQIQLIQSILRKNHFDKIKPFKAPFHYQKAILETIKKLKQENISPKEFTKHIQDELKNFKTYEDLYHTKGPSKGKIKAKYQRIEAELYKNLECSKVYDLYQEHLQQNGQYDFADMILFVVNAFKTDPELLAHYQEKFQYILVDEYQDTNSAQNEIIELLGDFYDNPNIFAVGDDEQSIFRFQGASLENILFFKQKYPQTKMIILEHNYRSGQTILDASRALITKNRHQLTGQLKISKKLISQIKQLKSQIKVGEFSNGSIESFFVAKEIAKLIKNGESASDIAVLYKEHRDAEELIDFLSKLNVPYKLEIGDNVLDDPEIGKIIKYLQALHLDENADEILIEVMHYPYLGISPLDIYKLIVMARKSHQTIFETIAKVIKERKKNELENIDALKDFYNIFIECRRSSYAKTFTAAFEYIIDASGYLKYLFSLKDNVRHFNRLQSLFEYIKTLNVKQKNLNLSKFLDHFRLLEDNDLAIKERELSVDYEGVNLMTAHKAKGLEFSHVFIIRMTDNHWGNKMRRELIKLPAILLKVQQMELEKDDSEQEPISEEEERRLFYVAMTRAKKNVYLTYALSYGEMENQTFTIPSKFLGEIPQRYIQKISPKVFEKQYDERLKITFGTKKWEYSEAMNDFLKKLVEDFSLSSTALNAYLDCPQQFLYDQLLRVPKAKTFSQAYGTAVHRALDLFFKDFIKTLRLPTKKQLLAWFEDSIKYEIWKQEDQTRALRQGGKILSDYYDFYALTWQKKGIPIATEFNFTSHNVHFNEIPITGIIDKIELLDKTANLVRIIDYKTAAPKSLNALLGKTKNKDTDYLFQAYFYKLLAEADPLFNWHVGEITFDFVAPLPRAIYPELNSERGRGESRGVVEGSQFKQITIPIEPKDYAEFKNIVKETYHKISHLEFPHDSQRCQKKTGECSYAPICFSNLNEK